MVIRRVHRKNKSADFSSPFFPFLMFHAIHLFKIILTANNRIGGQPTAWVMESTYVTSKHRTEFYKLKSSSHGK